MKILPIKISPANKELLGKVIALTLLAGIATYFACDIFIADTVNNKGLNTDKFERGRHE